MNTRETRMIVLGLVLGAAAGGAAIMLMRLRDTSNDQPLTTTVTKHLNWAELFSILAVSVTLARRIGQLIEPPSDAERG